MASSGLSFQIDTSNLVRKLDAYHDRLIALLRSEWQQILQECIADIASRAPDRQTEEAFVLGGPFLGLPLVTVIPADKGNQYGKSRPSYPYSGLRVHFQRAPGMYIEDAVKQSTNYKADPAKFTLELGRASFLEDATRFSYTNFSRKLGDIPHITKYGTWSFFEYGKTTTIVPNPSHWSNYADAKLKLADAYPSPWWVRWINKSYPALRMFSGFQRSFLQQAITSRVRAVKY